MAVTVPAATEQIDYADLYARWERGNWYDDFAELVSRRSQPQALMLRGRMRPWGDPRILLKLQRLFN